MMMSTSTLLCIAALLCICCSSAVVEESSSQQAFLALLKQDRAADALALLQQLPSDLQASPSMRVNFARAYVQLGREKDSENVLLEARQAHPVSMEVILSLVKLYVHTKRWPEADKALAEALLLDPLSHEAVALQGKVYMSRDKDLVKAQASLEAAYAIKPDDENVLFDLGMVLFYTNEHERGKAMLDAAETVNPTIDIGLLAKVYLHFKHFDWAEAALERALAASEAAGAAPKIETLLLQADTKDILNKPVEAAQLYRRVLSLDERSALAHAGLGLLLLGTGTRNFAAVSACGINQIEALEHLKLNPQLKQAEEAVKFCRQEFAEAQMWNGVTSKPTSSDVAASPRKGLFAKLLSSFRKALLSLLSGLLGRHHRPAQARRPSSDASERMRSRWQQRARTVEAVERRRIDDADTLFHAYVYANQPVVITNFQEGWAARSSFSRAALNQAFGDHLVRVSVSESGRFDGPEGGELWGLSPSVDVLVRPPATTMLLRDFLSLVNGTRTRETFYLEYLALSQYLGQRFLDLVPFPSIVENNLHLLDHLVTNLWIGGRPTTSPLHYDDYENLLCQITGEKELLLFPPDDLENLYYVGRPKGQLLYSYPSNFTRGKSALDMRGFVFGSSVHVDQPDFTRHPLYARARPLHVLLKPGDVLYLPAFWHHEVQSVPDATEGLNVAINYWFKNMTHVVDDVAYFNRKS